MDVVVLVLFQQTYDTYNNQLLARRADTFETIDEPLFTGVNLKLG